jgi:beta-aspartyl-peptidase (threonine type)
VAGVSVTRNPVRAARLVLDDDRLVFLAGPEADRYAAEQGAETVGPDWFETSAVSRAATATRPDPRAGDTVGAVAVDAEGHTAAATSTGGMPGQLPGRVGDSPVAGSGVWADDRTAAVSATGVGEAFLRSAAAHHVHMLCRAGTDLARACRSALDAVGEVGGYGGLIAVTAAGGFAFSGSGPLLIRGLASSGRAPAVRLFAEPSGWDPTTS